MAVRVREIDGQEVMMVLFLEINAPFCKILLGQVIIHIGHVECGRDADAGWR